MTEQFPDSCTFEGRRWAIQSWDGNTEVIPTNEQLGIRTEGKSTANYSGRIDHFLVHRDHLYLLKIEVSLPDDDRDQLPSEATREVVLRYEPRENFEGTRTKIKEARTEYFVFHDMVVPFTGSVVLTFPFFDFWEVPWPIDDADEELTDGVVLQFSEGNLIAARPSDLPADAAVSKDRWDFQFNEFVDKLQLAAVIGRDPIKRRAFCAQFARELAFVSLYLDALSVTGGDTPFYPDPPQECDFCKVAIEKQGFFVDGQTKGGLLAPWANMCPNCYADHGVGIGWGIGQLYRHGPNSGVWRCIAGGDPHVDTSEA